MERLSALKVFNLTIYLKHKHMTTFYTIWETVVKFWIKNDVIVVKHFLLKVTHFKIVSLTFNLIYLRWGNTFNSTRPVPHPLCSNLPLNNAGKLFTLKISVIIHSNLFQTPRRSSLSKHSVMLSLLDKMYF